MDDARLVAFVTASVVLAVTPGPGVVYIVTRTLTQGRAAGLASVVGVACGNFLNVAGASLGLAALLAVSSRAFTVVQVAGAAYLVWLGVQAWRAPATRIGERAALPPVPVGRLARDGLLVALLNPKTALFFGAFLPQFIDPARPALAQALALGALFVAIALCSDALYVVAATRLAPRLARLSGAQAGARVASATIYVALGVASLVFGQRRPG